MASAKPGLRPVIPHFSSGPCPKRPGWSLQTLTDALLGRSPDVAEVASAMFDAVRSLEDEDATELAEDEIHEETMRHIPHFLDEGWTWRR